MVYLLTIHPTQFAIVGNLNISNEELEMLNFIWRMESYGEPRPLFGIRTTNAVEGENNAMLYNDMRHQAIAQAIVTFISQCSEVCANLEKYYEKLMNQNILICKYAQSIIKNERNKSSNYRVRMCNSNDYEFNVVYCGKSSLVNIMTKQCCSCVIRHQLLLTCRHILSDIEQYNIMDYIPSYYKTRDVYQDIKH
jgi:hypothetical protein